MRLTLSTLLALLVLGSGLAFGHAERATQYPDRATGAVPKYRSTGTAKIVCKPGSAKRIRRTFKGRKLRGARRARLALVKRCRFRHVQAAVNAAKSGDRILVLPGVYREEPSRAIPVKDPKCSGPAFWEDSGDNHTEDGKVPTYLHQVECPNARNLIAIIGDSVDDPDRSCDQKCNLLVKGLGRRRTDVIFEGDRRKPDVIRADRADGFQLRNVTVEQGAYNNIDVVETNGFHLRNLVSRYASHYGILTFTSDHGLYQDITAYGSGDSGVYPGSGPEAHCNGFGIELRRIDSYGNTLGSSGTAGNGTWTHTSRFHDNAAGIANDSFAPGHPGMPQDCSKWTDNEINSNNVNFFDDANEAYCNATPFEQRRKEVVCPVFQVVVGTGFMLYGVNENTFQGNHIYDQHRNGVRLFHVPAPARGETDPAKANDTSHGNRFVGNTFGVRPDGTPDRNGTDVYWDEQGQRNCWEGNVTAPGVGLTSDPKTLPDCASGGSKNPVGNLAKLAADLPCIQWNPRTNPDPAGCTWFTTPADPGDGGSAARSSASGQRPALERASVLAPASFAGAVEGPGASAVGPLAWSGEVHTARPRELPSDRLVTGRLTNRSSSPMALNAGAARLLDDAGRSVTGTASFASGFSHGLYGPAVGPREAMPAFQARRLGVTTTIAPGDSVPFTVTWRIGDDGRAPTRVALGDATVALPGA